MIGGFIITGNDSKKVVIRAIGRSLQKKGVADALVDPVLELHGPNGSLIVTNDDWKDTQQQELEASGLAPTDDQESAISMTLKPGNYTAIVRGKGNTKGVALVEVYDKTTGSDSQLANISTRGFIQIGENVMIGGFILGGNKPSNVILRGIGPSLGDSGVSDPLADPTIDVRNKNGERIEFNDDWQDNVPSAALVAAHGLAPHDKRESALSMNLAAGEYTVILAGKHGGIGVGLVEIYDVR